MKEERGENNVLIDVGMSSLDAFSDFVTGFVWLLSFRKNALRFVVIYPASFFAVWVVI